MDDEQSQIIHGKEITYRRPPKHNRIKGETGEPKMKKIIPGSTPKAGAKEASLWTRMGGIGKRIS